MSSEQFLNYIGGITIPMEIGKCLCNGIKEIYRSFNCHLRFLVRFVLLDLSYYVYVLCRSLFVLLSFFF